ncbi:hypothetical protein LOAG_17345 [Loa loa]|uniref:Uncharacterized protein n=1 Tax=Loa loa TaxID=7209 RepID=A0A1S0UIW0_LOALO|nr:hypothetical protein LOAG_17345 [Loa loa]EJD75515.1 hypothetical protein LOAG_17345 [Loa loa]
MMMIDGNDGDGDDDDDDDDAADDDDNDDDDDDDDDDDNVFFFFFAKFWMFKLFTIRIMKLIPKLKCYYQSLTSYLDLILIL